MNGHDLLGGQPQSQHLARFSPLRDDRDFVPLNIDGPSSAPVPASVRPGSPARSNSVQAKLGRASSSKKWLLIAAAATAATIALAVGLGVGLSQNSSSSSSSSSSSGDASAGGGDGQQPDVGTPAQLYNAPGDQRVPPEACMALARGTAPGSNYWELLEAQQYNLTLELPAPLFQYNSSTWEGTQELFKRFTASSAVQFKVSPSAPQPVSCMLLNGVDLTITSVSLGGDEVCGTRSGRSCADYVGYNLARKTDGAVDASSTADLNLMAISLGDKALTPGQTQWVSLEYTGVLGAWPTSTEGLLQSAPFYSLDDETEAGLDRTQLQTLIVTQGAKLGTRRYLPCYDSPARKAVFSVTAKVPPFATVLSNTNELPSDGVVEGGLEVVQFEPTRLMSPYLLALAAGTLRDYGGAGGAGVRRLRQSGPQPQFRFYSVPGLEWQLAKADEIAPKAFKFFENYMSILKNVTNVTQPLDKFDFVAVPGKTGAMENWGLLMFDERRLLYNQAWEGAYGLQQVVNVICHEVAHQWFGNLATKADWTQVSVDEGLASYLEYPCMEAISSEFANTSNILFARFVSPQLEPPGPHDAPTHVALTYGSDPSQPAMVPENDLEIGTGTFIHYGKAAAILRSYELYLKENSGGNKDALRSVLARWVSESAYGTWEWSGLFSTLDANLKDTYAAANDTMKPAVERQIRTLETRAQSFWEAQDYQEIMDMIDDYYFTTEYTGKYTMATWFYKPLYPLVAPAVERVNTTSYNETLYNFGLTAKPFCSYRMSDELAQTLGIDAEVAKANEMCDYPAGRRFQPLTLALDNLTDCGTDNSNAAGGFSTPNIWPKLATQQPPSFVDNQHGARNFRSLYDDEHLEHMINVTASMRNVCSRNSTADTEDGTCCARQTDVLEAAGLISDATELAKVGRLIEEGASPFQPGSNMEPPLSRNNLTAVRVLNMTERVIMNGGDPSDGQWQFVMGSAASESLFGWKRVTDWLADGNCSRNAIIYINQVLERLGNQTAEEWLNGSAPPTDILKRITGPRLLWQLGMIDMTGQLAPKMCERFIKTNLWQRWLIGGQIKKDFSVSNVLPGPAHEPSDKERPAPPNSDTVPIDLVPALYMVGAALPGSCNAILLDSAGRNTTNSTADLLSKLIKATQDCAMYDEDPAEALRCLFAMPSLALSTNSQQLVEEAVKSTLGWLLGGGGPGQPGGDWDKQVQARFYQRKQLIADQRHAILTNMARSNPDIHFSVLDYLANSTAQKAMPDDILCVILDSMAPPANEAAYNKLMSLLTDNNNKSCQKTPMLRMRVAGKAEHFRELAAEQAEDICAFFEPAYEKFIQAMQG